MIASKVEKVYDLYFPAEVRGLLQAFTILFSFGMEGVPLECLGATGYEKKLVMWCAAARYRNLWTLYFCLCVYLYLYFCHQATG